jgi:hypothetical protein
MRILFFLILGVIGLLLYSNCHGSNERNLKQTRHSVNESDLQLENLLLILASIIFQIFQKK